MGRAVASPPALPKLRGPIGMRAIEPVRDGDTTRGGVRLHWEVYGEGDRTVFLMPTWSIIHSRHWKQQIPYLASRCRVLVMDGRGNGRSDRPLEPEAYCTPRARGADRICRCR